MIFHRFCWNRHGCYCCRRDDNSHRHCCRHNSNSYRWCHHHGNNAHWCWRLNWQMSAPCSCRRTSVTTWCYNAPRNMPCCGELPIKNAALYTWKVKRRSLPRSVRVSGNSACPPCLQEALMSWRSPLVTGQWRLVTSCLVTYGCAQDRAKWKSLWGRWVSDDVTISSYIINGAFNNQVPALFKGVFYRQ